MKLISCRVSCADRTTALNTRRWHKALPPPRRPHLNLASAVTSNKGISPRRNRIIRPCCRNWKRIHLAPPTQIYLAQLEQAQQRYPEAEQQLPQALADETVHPTGHAYPQALIPLASLYVQQQDYAKAEPLLQQALSAQQQPQAANSGASTCRKTPYNRSLIWPPEDARQYPPATGPDG
ncbi:MAG: tetratricopeptide repeat protein [Thiolinea sp.]